MSRIVIVGAGVGGVPAALEMRHYARKEDEVVVVSDTPTFHFVPSNPWVAFGWRKPGKIKVELAPMFKKKKIGFIQKKVAKVVPAENKLSMEDGSSESYDFLIVATGAGLAFDEIPGLGPAGFTSSVCHVDHAEHTFEQWNQFAANPGPLVVGATQGASCFGPAYEYALQADTDLRRKKIRNQVPITFVTSEPYVGHLGLGGVGDSNGMIENMFREKSIRWICNAKIDKVEKGKVTVIECDENGDEKKRHELPFGQSMFIPPFTGVDAVRGVEGLSNPRGFTLANEFQQNPNFKNVFSLGVAVAIAPKEPTPVPTGVPKTGLMIESMGVSAAKNIRAMLDGKEPYSIPPLNALCIADTGDSGLGFAASPQIPPRNLTMARAGWLVHLVKVIFEKYYLRKIRRGITSPFYEQMGLRMLGVPTMVKDRGKK